MQTDEISTRDEALAVSDIFSPLPDEMMIEIERYLTPAEGLNLQSVSIRIHSLFQSPNQLFNKFLQRVAYGMHDKVEQLFTVFYAGDLAKIQEVLRYQGVFTDYSGRTFKGFLL